MSHQKPEILAPAGGPEELEAALSAGADAVYFGLKKLNARTGARNFSPESLSATVQKIHDAHAKAYLTLNTSLTQRELGLALRTLALAEQSGVDAVLICDPALLTVVRDFPKLSFHFSTQAAVSSSAGVEAAKYVGITRTVLARELSADEMRAAAAVTDMEIEVFVQGALCFCCSGRCLLSSWVGGRSGNRGACASPCRVKWTGQNGQTGHPLSMHDLCLVRHLDELSEIGIASLKIEGRLKSAPWVSQTVRLYREALDGQHSDESFKATADKLGAYAGRQWTDAYFCGIRSGVTGESARPAGRLSAECGDCASTASAASNAVMLSTDERDGTCWLLRTSRGETSLRIPPQRIATPRHAVTLKSIADDVSAMLTEDGIPAAVSYSTDQLSERLLPRSARKRILDETASFLRLQAKTTDGIVRDIVLPDAVKQVLESTRRPCAANCHPLGDRPTLLRVTCAQAEKLLVHPERLPSKRPFILDASCLCSETDAPSFIQQLLALAPWCAAVALPAVIYEKDIPVIKTVLSAIATQLTVEVNSWDTWWLARQSSAAMVAGPGLAVLNAMAARTLDSFGCRWSTVSCEIDSDQLQALSASAETPLALTLFSYPILMQTRAVLPDDFNNDTVLSDGRNVRLRPQRTGSTTLLRSMTPMDWRRLKNPKVRAAQLIVDLTGAGDDLFAQPLQTSLFNYDRRLR